jgi:hypothetical protein
MNLNQKSTLNDSMTQNGDAAQKIAFINFSKMIEIDPSQ